MTAEFGAEFDVTFRGIPRNDDVNSESRTASAARSRFRKYDKTDALEFETKDGRDDVKSNSSIRSNGGYFFVHVSWKLECVNAVVL